MLVLRRGYKVFEAGLETAERNLVGKTDMRESIEFLLGDITEGENNF